MEGDLIALPLDVGFQEENADRQSELPDLERFVNENKGGMR